MKPDEASPPSTPAPAPVHPVATPVTDGHTGPYWDALRKLPRVRIGGSIAAGLVLSARRPAVRIER